MVLAFGVLLWELVTHGNNPYEEISPGSVVVKKLHGGYRLPCPADCPPHLQKLMNCCWEWEPEKRPNFREVSSMLINSTAVPISEGKLTNQFVTTSHTIQILVHPELLASTHHNNQLLYSASSWTQITFH